MSSPLKLSIIIPAYNAQDYIDRCIHSALKQDLNPSDYEIIVVDDGSSDQTGKFVTEIASQFTNVTLITQENKGEGGARNTGIKGAQGKYILFLDSDDYLFENTIHRLIQIADNEDLDILMYDFFYTKIQEQPYKNHLYFSNSTEVMSGAEFFKNNSISWYSWLYLIRKDYLVENGITFREKILFADTDFSLKIVLFSKRIKYIEMYVLYWYYNTGSITRSKWSIIKANDQLLTAKELSLIALNIKNMDKQSYLLMQHHIYAIYWTLLKNSRELSASYKLELCKEINAKSLGSEVPIKYNPYFNLINKLIRVSPRGAAYLIHFIGHCLILFMKFKNK
jgi:glycosyltransferase involved in cell wall biosynthesis